VHLHWHRHGGNGPPLLLVHGFLTSHSQWLANLEALRAVCEPVTVDLFGHGDSPAPDDPRRYRPEAYVDAFDAIRHRLGVDQWLVCGYSLGAGLTLRYAFECPERVAAHAFTNSSSGLATREEAEAWRAGAAESAARIRDGGIAAIERIPVHPRHATRLPKPVYEALMRDAVRLDPIGIAHTLTDTNPDVSARERLGENRSPCLLICGRRETRFDDKRAFAIANMPHLEVADLDVGHGVNMEDPPAFDAVLVPFIRRFASS
jgi:pimeloyl-ACP methyl ester carboxylesterase